MSTVGFDLFRCPFCARERTMRKLKTMEVQKYTGWNKSMTCKPDILFDVLWPNCREADIIDYLTGQSKGMAEPTCLCSCFLGLYHFNFITW